MKQAISPRSAASWLFYVLIVGLSPIGFAQQTLPPLIPVNVSNFTIPFEIGESVQVIREVELLVSQDRGRRWQFVARQPAESGKFTFRADDDGEYWFAFRTITSTGNSTSMTGHPELRVLVNTRNPVISPPPRPSESGPVVPPKPEKFRQESNTLRPQPMQPASTEVPKPEQETKLAAAAEKVNVEKPGQILAPRFPGFDPSESEKNREDDLLDDLLSRMSPFLDVQPAARRSVSGSQVAGDGSNAAPNVSNASNTPRLPTDAPAGRISDVILTPDTRPQIVVRWHTGNDLWEGAQIDVFRSSSNESQWSPIAINLPNSGEYWWYLSPEDLQPFYIAIRIRSLHGGSSVDVTQRKIEIDDSRLAVFQSQRP